VVFVDDADLARMHGEWLGDGSPTDVISFDLGEDEPGPVGELYVSAERARAVAAERGLDERRELALYVVHGALHLCGFDDHEPAERERMRAAEAIVLGSLGYAPGPGVDDD
jgi:probable rRNA maturation factor